MVGKSPDQNQRDVFTPLLKDFINPTHELVQLANMIDWKVVENHFLEAYSNTGQPAKPIRLMVGLLILQRTYNHSDENLVEAWKANPYYQYFCGEAYFQWNLPCHPTDLVYFRKRIGPDGCRWIFELSVKTAGADKARSEAVSVDTTVQEKNITYPTDAKLYYKAARKLWAVAATHNVELRQSYRRVFKKLLRQSWFGHHPRRKKAARQALRKMKVRLGRLLRDVQRKLDDQPTQQHQPLLDLIQRLVNQQRGDSNKIYSMHEPDVACIAKGKAHKKYEFGSKVSLAVGQRSGLIVGVETFKGNPHDSQTLAPTLERVESAIGKKVKTVAVDRGYQGAKKHIRDDIELILPDNGKGASSAKRRRKRRYCRRRAGIEPIIGHIKTDCRMQRNYLSGWDGDQINALLAAAGFNFRKLLREVRSFLSFFYRIIGMTRSAYTS